MKLGLNPHNRPDTALLALDWQAGQVPAYEPAVDRLVGVSMALDGNDQFSDCGPTSVDNHDRTITRALTGTEVDAALADVFDLYRRSGNPGFTGDPNNPGDDNGVTMPDLLAATANGGLGGRKILAYARLKDMSDASIYAAIDLFGAVLFAVDLQVAQQGQTNQSNPVWDYVASGDWGMHAICAASYDSSTGRIDVVSWGMRVGTTPAFRQNQLQEVWIPIWPEVIGSNRFVQSVAVDQLAADYQALTGKTLPVPAPPAPAPDPTPAPPAPAPDPAPPTPPAPAPTPAPPGGDASFHIDDPAVVARITALAAHRSVTPDQWLTHHLVRYFRLVDEVVADGVLD